MKKTISVILSVLFVFMTLVPAFAAEGDTAGAGTQNFNVTFTAPSKDFEGGYMFVKTVNGEIQYVPDAEGEYVFFNGRYMLPSNIIDPEDVPEERFSAVEWDDFNEVAEGETVSFKVVTSEKYNVLTAVVFINGAPTQQNALDEYTVYVDRDINISVGEYDENGQPALLRNHFNVKLTSGDEYKVLTLKNEYYHVTYYGDSFRFRVKVNSGYSAAGMKVMVQRGKGILNGLLDDEDLDSITGLIGGAETLTSYGVDEDGCRLYEIENITTDCKVIVSGVQEEGTVGILSMLKRILRLILDFLGIHLDFVDDITAYYNVKVDGAQAPDGVTYQVIRSTTTDAAPSEFTVTGGDGISIIVTKDSIDREVTVMWTPGNETGTYQTEWIPSYDHITGKTSYSAIYNVDNISADTVVTIY
ncbi:MAG: hypothetical protein J6A97_01570 [Clostridia bacterium]|nr:hypothetical protein [Clostridia bacterium]